MRRVKQVEPGRAGIPDAFAEAVLDLVARIPAGRVMAYGDVARAVAATGEPGVTGGPRQVGRVMARYGGGVPWWRVVRADGTVAPGLERRAASAHRAEGTPLRPDGVRVDMARARWTGTDDG